MRKLCRISCIALAVLLLVSACAPRATELQADSLTGVDENAMFPYYTMKAGDYNRSSWGLLNAKGEFVLPQEYSYIGDIYPYNNTMLTMPAHEDRFFAAQRFEDITEELRRQAEENGGYVDLETLSALVSPRGEILTDFVYATIVTYPGEDRFLAVARPDNRIVWLDRTGAETPVTESDILEDYLPTIRWVFDEDLYGYMRQGPDVPRDGFEQVIDLRDGRYWGGHTYSEEEIMALEQGSPYTMPADDDEDEIEWNVYDTAPEYWEENDGKEIWETRFYLYTAEGERIGDKYYYNMGKIADGLYCAGTNPGGTYENVYYELTDENGIALNDEVYGSVWYGGYEPYFITQQGGLVKVYEIEGLKLHNTFEVEADDDVWPYYNNEGMFYIEVCSLERPPRLLLYTDREEELVLEAYPGYTVNEVNQNYDRFVISRIIDWENWDRSDGEPEYDTKLVGLDGKVYMDDRYSIYSSYGVLVDYEQGRGSWSNSRVGLYDWDGNELLPHEYVSLNVCYGGVAHVIRGQWTGLIDLQGNWIYRESVYTGLE